MKKAIFIILLVLPLFLMVTISVAGNLIIRYVPTPVEGIRFEDENGDELSTIYISKGEEHAIVIEATVYPALASNKKVHYTLFGGEGKVVFDELTNTVTGIDNCSATLRAVTDEKGFSKDLEIVVSERFVTGIELNRTEITLQVGDSFKLEPAITPETAENKSIIWSSSDSTLVEVTVSGVVIPLAVTTEPVVITATTVDGEFTAECLVTVTAGVPLFAFYNGETPYKQGDNIMINADSVNLLDYLRIEGEQIVAAQHEIIFTRVAGNDGATLDGSTVSFNKKNGYITVEASVVLDGQQVTCRAIFARL